MADQLISTKELPETLWKSASGELALPPNLVSAYAKLVDKYGLQSVAIDTNPGDGPIGEDGQQGALDHFGRRFTGSCGRVQLYSLDPHHTFQSTRDSFCRLFSSGSVRLLDIPFGAGAAAATLLSVVAELRSAKLLPRLDLVVSIFGGEKNSHQLKLAQDLFAELAPWWLENAIKVIWKFRKWDVLIDDDTTDLVDDWLDAGDQSPQFAVVVANFSGFLWTTTEAAGQRRYFDEAEPCLRQIFSRAGKAKAAAYWLEPNRGPVAAKFFPKLKERVFKRFARFEHVLEGFPSSEADLTHPMVAGNMFKVRAVGAHWRSNSL